MYHPRYEKLKRQMEADGLDLVIACSPENSYYFMQTYIVTQTTLRDRLGLGLFPLDGEPAFVACSVERSIAEAECWIKDKRYYTEFVQSPMEPVIQILREKGFARRTIGLEMDYLTTRFYRELTEALPEATFVSCTNTLKKVRMVKEPLEIECLSRAAQGICQAVEKAFSETSVGDTERMLDHRIKRNLLDLGAQDFTFYCMGTGEKSLLVHALPDDTVFTQGEVMRMDYGARFSLYNADLARTAVIGPGCRKHIEIFQRLCEVYYEVVSTMRAGVSTRELFDLCKTRCAAARLPFTMPHIGHSLGIDLHEEPMLSPSQEFILQENMVFNVEPLITCDGRLYHIEDTILIKKDGYEVLSQPQFNPHILYIR
ncbi:Xaa-Pro peptidase family protein [Oscillibacter sp. MSJ-2]|uniref:Xaa-Pro peptidase family protein n=1 Tax=Dysosmobacter acutus TaxID=2841504 RepID=A0ABS6FB73_9FIRM|nr:Xaa-Pro peptidase family protein [Dysosmobacter acutus]MBU5626906.1 Xaa-Pro peptidase family protein [Dysosmobacter acutus]